MPTIIRKVYTDESEEELLAMSRDDVTELLTDREKSFCENLMRNRNIKLAAIKAGYSKKSAHIVGWKLRQKYEVNRYIAWLKLRVCKVCNIEAIDIIDMYVRIAFADITDFVLIKDNKLKLVNADEIDGQLISKIKQGREGISVELSDRLSALDKLERYLDVMPKDWREKIEERKIDIMERKLEFEMKKEGLIDSETEDDGFLDALKDSAKEVWDE